MTLASLLLTLPVCETKSVATVLLFGCVEVFADDRANLQVAREERFAQIA